MSNAYELIANLRSENIIQSKKIFESLILEKCNELVEIKKEELKDKIFNKDKNNGNRAALGNAMAAISASKKKENIKEEYLRTLILSLMDEGYSNEEIENAFLDEELISELNLKSLKTAFNVLSGKRARLTKSVKNKQQKYSDLKDEPPTSDEIHRSEVRKGFQGGDTKTHLKDIVTKRKEHFDKKIRLSDPKRIQSLSNKLMKR